MRILDYAIYILIIFGVYTFMSSVRPVSTPTPHGILLPQVSPDTLNTKKTSAKDIQLYQRLPENAQTLGIINVQYHQPADDLQAPEEMTDYAMKLAADAKANGMAIRFIGHSQDPTYSVLSGYKLVATAVNAENAEETPWMWGLIFLGYWQRLR